MSMILFVDICISFINDVFIFIYPHSERKRIYGDIKETRTFKKVT